MARWFYLYSDLIINLDRTEEICWSEKNSLLQIRFASGQEKKYSLSDPDTARMLFEEIEQRLGIGRE